MKNMATFRCVVLMIMMVGCVATLQAQSNPPLAVPVAPPPTTAPATDPAAVAAADQPTHYGMRHADFAQLNQAMLEVALDDAEIQALDAEVEALLAKREALLVEKTIGRQPALAERLRTMQRNVAELKRQQTEQKEQAKAFRKSNPLAGTPVAVPQN